MEAPSSRQSRMTIDSLLNPSGDRHHRNSISYPSPSPTSTSTSPYYYSQYNYPPSPQRYSFPDPGYSDYHYYHRPSYPSYSYYLDQPRGSFSFTQAVSPPSSPYSRDRYDSVSSNSSAALTTASSASASSTSTAGPSTSTTTTDRRRPPRPKYEEEEMYFIWYHRVDLCQEWKEVRENFNRQFPNRQRSGFQGIQCKFYRFIRDKKCPTLREQRRMRDGEFLHGSSEPVSPTAVEVGSGGGGGGGGGAGGGPKFGVVEWMGVWYPWMRENREQVRMKRISR